MNRLLIISIVGAAALLAGCEKDLATGPTSPVAGAGYKTLEFDRTIEMPEKGGASSSGRVTGSIFYTVSASQLSKDAVEYRIELETRADVSIERPQGANTKAVVNGARSVEEFLANGSDIALIEKQYSMKGIEGKFLNFELTLTNNELTLMRIWATGREEHMP